MATGQMMSESRQWQSASQGLTAAQPLACPERPPLQKTACPQPHPGKRGLTLSTELGSPHRWVFEPL